MTTYKEIFGKPVKVLSTDPTDAEAEGQVWYNSTSGTFKTKLPVSAWASSGNMSAARTQIGGAGSESSGLAFGGEAASNTNSTEENNGSAWTGGGNYPSQDESIMACGLTVPPTYNPDV